MNTCPIYSHSLLSHVRTRDRYWYCRYCRLEISAGFISARNKATLHESLLY